MTVTTKVASAATATLLQSGTGPNKRRIITNTDANILYIVLGAEETVTASIYTYQIAPGASFQVDGYTGAIYGIWASDGTGYAVISAWA
jgi:hypothetical protein